MAASIEAMMQHKIDAIKRIMEIAENIALAHKYDKNMGHRLRAGSFSYNNAKKLNVLDEDDDAGGDEYSRYLSQYRDKDDEHYRVGVVVPLTKQHKNMFSEGKTDEHYFRLATRA